MDMGLLTGRRRNFLISIFHLSVFLIKQKYDSIKSFFIKCFFLKKTRLFHFSVFYFQKFRVGRVPLLDTPLDECVYICVCVCVCECV